MGPEEIISLLNLKPLPGEGGYFRETYRSTQNLRSGHTRAPAIYYMITAEEFSAFHRVPQDEIFHFYLGDPVRLVQIDGAGRSHESILGPQLAKGQQLQGAVPGGVWQGLRMVEGGQWALLGTQVFPGFDFKDFESADRAAMVRNFPRLQKLILEFTR